MNTIWILNHYATGGFFLRGGRHYNFAKHLIREGYEVKIFCANTMHNLSQVIPVNDKGFVEKSVDGISFVFIEARKYTGNGIQRGLNMLDYYMHLKRIAKYFDKPDVIIGSSVHPLACVGAIKLSKKFKCKNIVEIRDLWPESIVAFDILSRKSPIIKIMYSMEKWIYTKADSIIFTMEGGKDYIVEKGWDTNSGGTVNINKVYHINNGVDLEIFNYNKEHYTIDDDDLDSDAFKVVYTGSIRKANQVDELVYVAKELYDREINDITILIWGIGNYEDRVQQLIDKYHLKNIKLKGHIEKKYIPFILSKSDLNVYLLKDSPLYQFGLSLNKSFEYFASGKPVLTNHNAGYSIIDKYKCGICINECDTSKMANKIIDFKHNKSKNEYRMLCEGGLKAAEEYDFRNLTTKLIDVIENKEHKIG